VRLKVDQRAGELKSSQVYLFNNEFKRAVIINAMLNRNDKAMKALTVTLM